LPPVTVLASVPGIGPRLAERLHEELGLSTLEGLEAAAHDGRLETIAGIGEKRIAGIRDSLAHRLGRLRPPPREPSSAPPLSEVLDVDREYLYKVATRELPLIAPRRFNPTGEAWLPILHTTRGARHYTALFSNTARAHRAGRTKDWVVIYGDDATGERPRRTLLLEEPARRSDREPVDRLGSLDFSCRHLSLPLGAGGMCCRWLIAFVASGGQRLTALTRSVAVWRDAGRTQRRPGPPGVWPNRRQVRKLPRSREKSRALAT
jgi:hypothetical protein